MAAAVAGVAPRVMGIGPVPASPQGAGPRRPGRRALDVIELNEAFAAQASPCCAISALPTTRRTSTRTAARSRIGHPLGASGARLVTTAMYQLGRTKGRYALCTMCIGVGQGIAVMIERV